MSNTVQLPVLSLSIAGIAPTVDVSDDNRAELPRLRAAAEGVAPSAAAGQDKLRYNGNLSITTRLDTLG